MFVESSPVWAIRQNAGTIFKIDRIAHSFILKDEADRFLMY